MNRIYLDYNATTPPDPAVIKAVAETMTGIFGNPSSIHSEGRRARRIVDDARESMSSLLNCNNDEIVFTGSGSESNNLAIKGVAYTYKDKVRHFITSKAEHPSVLNTFKYLEGRGMRVSYLEVDRDGQIDVAQLAASISGDTVMASLMTANNETGVISPIRKISSILRERGVLFHTDAVQAVGKIGVDVEDLGVDLLSLAGHKFYGPKGVGALYVRKGLELLPIIHGGGQELGRRAGTEDLAGISGLAKAADLAKASLSDEMVRLEDLKRYAQESIRKTCNDVVFISEVCDSLPNTICAAFKGLSAESLVMALDMEGIAISAGSACSSGALSPSHVLAAMGLEDDVIRGTVRISLGRWTTREELDGFLEILGPLTDRLSE